MSLYDACDHAAGHATGIGCNERRAAQVRRRRAHGQGERLIDIDGRQVRYTDQSAWMSLATLTGLPATAMPVARSDEGLPIGVQAIGPFLEDRTPLAFAQLCEREFGGFVAPPGFG